MRDEEKSMRCGGKNTGASPSYNRVQSNSFFTALDVYNPLILYDQIGHLLCETTL